MTREAVQEARGALQPRSRRTRPSTTVLPRRRSASSDGDRPKGAIRDARYLAEEKGIKLRHLHPRVLSPLPENQIRHFLVGLKQVIIVEENYTGQFAHFIKGKFGIKPVEIHKYEGVPITPEEILRGIEKVARIVDEENITRL